MTHKIKVQMFGNFRMDYNGAPFVAEKMHKESQFNRMMQALIHYSDCGIAKDKLEEIVIGERDIDAPHTALRVIVYKTKQKLAQLGLPGKNLIYLEGGIYYWTPDIEIEEDAAEFEKLYNEACALEKQMPQEPESAETVCDERIKEIEDNMLELYVKALYLYKGEFLAAYTGETWIAQEARRYELVLSGASMGTFGSLYYGSKLSPHALLLAKPLANMGNVARNERILRAGGFATSLDILMKNYDNLSDEAIEQLNNRMWDRFDSADWSQTKFIISYLYEDDYDPDGYPSILSHLKSSGVEVYGKGSHGRHTDNSSNVMAWFKSQYNNLLHDDFSR